MKLSLVIPAYNEEDRIGATLEGVQQYLAKQDYDWEVILVDDGGTDRCAEVAKQVLPNVEIIRYEPNRGKGFAVKTGMQAARGDYRVFFDADASTPIYEVEKLWPKFDAGAEVVIGSRQHPDSDIAVHQAKYREMMGRSYNVILRGIGLSPFVDTQCGFKGFTAKSCDIIFPKQTIERFGFDCELLYIAQLHGLRIEEIPVRWENSPASRVSPIADSLKMFQEMLVVRINALRGRYSD